jgi:Na+-transporting NADH:ubiquinone oxidoreductase subunit A
VIEEYDKKEFFGWVAPGFNKFSVKNLFFSSILRKKSYALNTSAHGGERSIYPVESYEEVMPLDILPTFLLRSLVMEDIEECENLGALELDEEDLALCTFVSASKMNYGAILRKNLTILEKEG